MTVTVTSIQNKEIDLDVEDLRRLLSYVNYPEYLQDYEELTVMIVCVRGERHEHDAFACEGEAYVTLAFDYEVLAGRPFEGITTLCKIELMRYLRSMDSIPVREAA